MTQFTPEKLLAAHKVLVEHSYELRPVVRGYAGRTLYVNLSENQISEKIVSEEMKDLFTGGRGFGLRLLWNGTRPETRWDDPENELILAGGPIGGITAYPGTGKVTALTISPLTHTVIDSNGGGYFGPYLKFAGWDALEIQGKASEDIIIYIDGDRGRVTIEAAPLEAIDTHMVNRQLTEMYAEDERDMRNISMVSAGQAADHAAISGLNISFYDPRRMEVRIKQCARGGCGRVLRDKHIKGIVVRYSSMSGDSNGVANMELLRKAGKRINKEIVDFDAAQNDMRNTGTPYLVEIMDRFDLLPVQNFRYGSHPDHKHIAGEHWKQKFDHSGPDGCWYGCTMACSHVVTEYTVQTGPYKGDKVAVDGPEYETLGALGSNICIFDRGQILELNFYADTYGLDSISLGNSIAFAMECWEYGILNSEITGGMELTWGNFETVIELIHQMARGEGFGVIVGQGIRFMRKYFIENYGAEPKLLEDISTEIKGLEMSEYMTKESLAQQGGYALAIKGPQHDEAWLIFMEQVHKQLPTFEAKAEALHYFPVFRTWFSLHGLCKLPWNDIIPESNKTAAEPQKVPEHVENYLWLMEGVSGKKATIDDLLLQSEKVYTFQRLFNLRMGYGTREYDYPPYRAVGPATVKEYESRQERYDNQLCDEIGLDPAEMSTVEKIAAVRTYREDRYEQLINAVYSRRGWDQNGIPTLETLQRLGLDAIPELVELVKERSAQPF
jgi:aldehyde:ferredoxin oxidoreductase